MNEQSGPLSGALRPVPEETNPFSGRELKDVC